MFTPPQTFQWYQREAHKTAVYPQEHGIVYPLIKLGEESGEVQGKYGKYLREDYDYDTMRNLIAQELGDVLWYAAEICTVLGLDMEYVARQNILKLQERQQRGVLKGSGDNR